MNLHRNARTTPASRAEMVRRVLDEGQAAIAVARAFGVELKTVKKWVARFETEGSAGLVDRSSRPHRLRGPTPPETVERIIALRRERLPGKQIAAETGVSRSTVSRKIPRLNQSGPKVANSRTGRITAEPAWRSIAQSDVYPNSRSRRPQRAC